MRKPAEGIFELGLVMAGAVSAGAYTAGVLDFLFEALEEMEAAKAAGGAGDGPLPDHLVQIKAAAGASAGGIAAALAAMVPLAGLAPVRDLATARHAEEPAAAGRNLLYRSWVLGVDLHDLLGTRDLGCRDRVCPSLLDGTALERVAAAAVDAVRDAPAVAGIAPWLANPLDLRLCLTNLRGLPYLIRMVGEEGRRGHRMVSHADYAHLAVFGTSRAAPGPLPPGAVAINRPGTGGEHSADGWQLLADAALATAAFPLGLPARLFAKDGAQYLARPWPRPGGADPDGGATAPALDLPPWRLQPYRFWCVDGGMVDNEPLELARTALSGGPDRHNPRDPRRADRAVILIDPFPDDPGEVPAPLGEAPDLLAVARALLPALLAQARFRPGEVALALEEDVHSRFLIAPRRSSRQAGESDLAAAGQGGFAGFVDVELRMHDFQLGRRNCQKFLQGRLAVHVDNPLVRGWVRRLRAAGGLERHQPADGPGRPGCQLVRLVPLFGTAAREVMPRPWPRLDWRRLEARLGPRLQARTDALVPELMALAMRSLGLDRGGLARRMLRGKAMTLARERIPAQLLAAIRADLAARRLI